VQIFEEIGVNDVSPRKFAHGVSYQHRLSVPAPQLLSEVIVYLLRQTYHPCNVGEHLVRLLLSYDFGAEQLLLNFLLEHNKIFEIYLLSVDQFVESVVAIPRAIGKSPPLVDRSRSPEDHSQIYISQSEVVTRLLLLLMPHYIIFPIAKIKYKALLGRNRMKSAAKFTSTKADAPRMPPKWQIQDPPW